MKKPILLPTKEATNIYLETKDKLAYKPDAEVMSFIDNTPANQYLYIVDTEAEIKEVYLAYSAGGIVRVFTDGNTPPMYNKFLNLPENKKDVIGAVIATTDKTLGLPLINEEFVKLFVEKQGKIEEVDVEFEGGGQNVLSEDGNNLLYEWYVAIVTPKESSFKEKRQQAMDWWDSLTMNRRIFLISEYGKGITGREIQEIWETETQFAGFSKCYPEGKPIDEAYVESDDVESAIKQLPREFQGTVYEDAFKAGVQWHQKRSYTRKEVIGLMKDYRANNYEALDDFIKQRLTKGR